MGKSLLSLIAKQQRERLQETNIIIPDDAQLAGLKTLPEFNERPLLIYKPDKLKESERLTDLGARRLSDIIDFNILQATEYIPLSIDDNDTNVIDAPEIEEIAPSHYEQLAPLNIYGNVDYVFPDIELAIAPSVRYDNYTSYIETIRFNINNRGFNLEEIFLGKINEDDSQLGVIAGQQLNVLLNEQFIFNTQVETLGKVNNDVFSLLETGQLFREDYDITVRGTVLGRQAEFLRRLQGIYDINTNIPDGVFYLDTRRIVETSTGIKYQGINLTNKERIALLMRFTGKGQQTYLINSLKNNLYNNEIIGRFETLVGNTYIRDFPLEVDLNLTEFNVTFANSIPDGLGGYEKYGTSSIGKKERVGDLFSERDFLNNNRDIPVVDSLGWVVGNDANRFDKKSLLYKTQNILNGFENGASSAFIDMSTKEYVEVVNGETKIISRGDMTTASGDYVDDDGTQISKGEFFRVWTKNRGYSRLDRTLRHRGLDNGDTRSVLNPNGLPNVAPTFRSSTDEFIKRYMFSIENLAWADFMDDLPLCEQGAGDPVSGTRGRIMWFPPYDLKIDESVEVNNTSTEFIGRGEPIFTHNNSTRSATLSFAMIVDHPDVVHKIVGEKTEVWERYFKGDKLVESNIQLQNFVKNRLSQSEIDEIQKRQQILKPRVKQNDNVNITQNRKNAEEEIIADDKLKNGDLGQTAISIYFPNNETNIPRSPFLTDLQAINSDPFVVDSSLTENDLKEKNVGYEDFGISDTYNITTSDGIAISTTNGIRYVKNGIPLNKTYTYNNGKLIDNTRVCRTLPNPPRGYSDETNFGKNRPFYFEWKEKFYDLLKDAKKAKISFLGRASAAVPPVGTTNNSLARRRAESAKEWFDNNVAIFLQNQGLDIEFDVDFGSVGDKEDIDNLANGLPACEDCDRADTDLCKEARRVDIVVRVLEENEEPEPIVPTTGSTTVDEDITTDPLTPDPDEDTQDPTDPIEDVPVLDPEVLKKLIYTECDFFEYLETDQPLVYNTISERIKYFSPVYHSMTPQGFNSRLTFLHQCTKQGDSIGRDGIENWKNLAFGRQPVCILRIGDFYHTRCIIDSLTINYNEGMTWDLNPEGIGVQPMYCDITLSLKLLGGSSMAAPINRLQNALSFNYYANTEMYDARADSVVFEDKNEVDADGNVNDSETFGALKGGRIVDGIRLSTLSNFTETEKQERLAKIRKQSRVNLTNSTTAQVPQDQIEDLGEVESLLELKKTLGIRLTDDEKVVQRNSDSVDGKFESAFVSETTQNQVQTFLRTSSLSKDTILSVSAQQFVDNPSKQLQGSDLQLAMRAILENTVTKPEELSQRYIDQVSLEYIELYKDTFNL